MSIGEFARLYWPSILAGAAVIWALRLVFLVSPMKKAIAGLGAIEPSEQVPRLAGARGHLAAFGIAVFVAIGIALGQYLWSGDNLATAVLRPLVILFIPMAYFLGWAEAKGSRWAGFVRSLFLLLAVVAGSITIFLLRR